MEQDIRQKFIPALSDQDGPGYPDPEHDLVALSTRLGRRLSKSKPSSNFRVPVRCLAANNNVVAGSSTSTGSPVGRSVSRGRDEKTKDSIRAPKAKVAGCKATTTESANKAHALHGPCKGEGSVVMAWGTTHSGASIQPSQEMSFKMVCV